MSIPDSSAMSKSTDGKILERLQAALRKDGDFPVRARVVAELRELAAKPRTPIEQISELILREPTLGTRVLHLVNSAFYQRPQPITTVTQAVTALGMKALSEMCAGMVLMQKFIPSAKKGGVFADSVKRTIITSLLSNRIASYVKLEGLAEQGYLAGTFYSLGQMLLAYYFPQVYETAAKRAHARGKEVSKSIAELMGATSEEVALSIVDALAIPDYYRDVMVLAHMPLEKRRGDGAKVALSVAVSSAAQFSEAIVHGNAAQLDQVLNNLVAKKLLPKEKFQQALCELPNLFKQHCEMVELDMLTLPDFIINYKDVVSGKIAAVPKAAFEENGFPRYVAEMRAAIEGKEPVSVITTLALEALVYGLGFERALLLYADSEHEKLSGRLSLGKPTPVGVKSIERICDNLPDAVDVKCFMNGLPQYLGDGLFADGWPYVCVPIGVRDYCKGVIYADIITKPGTKPIGENEQAALSVLTDLLDAAVKAWE